MTREGFEDFPNAGSRYACVCGGNPAYSIHGSVACLPDPAWSEALRRRYQ